MPLPVRTLAKFTAQARSDLTYRTVDLCITEDSDNRYRCYAGSKEVPARPARNIQQARRAMQAHCQKWQLVVFTDWKYEGEAVITALGLNK